MLSAGVVFVVLYRWRFVVKRVRLLVVLLCLTGSVAARAETGEARFRNLLMISGYSTVIGAAFGAALLAFTAEPGENLDYIARAAAIGFLGGVAVGSFMVFSPLFIGRTLVTQLFAHATTGVGVRSIAGRCPADLESCAQSAWGGGTGGTGQLVEVLGSEPAA